MVTATDRADLQIHFPGCQQQFFRGHSGVETFEPLSSLDVEDQPEVFRFHTVVQEPVVTDLPETVRQDMQQEPPYKLRVRQGDHATRVTVLSSPGGK